MKYKTSRNIKKIRKIIENNQPLIRRIVLSEDFLSKLEQNPLLVDFKEITDDEKEIHEWLLYGVPVKLSKMIKKGCILEMKNGEIIFLKSI
jgi:hypothetical protein